MNHRSTLPILNAVSLAATLLMNYLANALPFNGQTTGEISNRFPVLFKPADYVFVIWGLIYLALLAYAIYQALPEQQEKSFQGIIGFWFIVSNVANICWLLAWHYEAFALSVLLMLLILASLIIIYIRLDIGYRQVGVAEEWLVHKPFSIYLAWIWVATIANITIALEAAGWGGLGIAAEAWFILLLLATLSISFYIALRHYDTAYTLVILWAVIGIAYKNTGATEISEISWIAAGLALIPIIMSFMNRPLAAV